jgi:hypothetical protein
MMVWCGVVVVEIFLETGNTDGGAEDGELMIISKAPWTNYCSVVSGVGVYAFVDTCSLAWNLYLFICLFISW